jgi:HD-like signal output (HDOD) protein
LEAIQKRTYVLTPADYLKSIKYKQLFSMQFDVFSQKIEAIFIKVIHRLVQKHDILYLKEMLITVIKEIITNAVKANTKRLYFKIMKLDINKKEDYRVGMDTFKRDVYAGKVEIFNKLKDENLFVKIIFKNDQNSLQISIINNSPILEEESRKIEWRIRKAYSYDQMSDAFDDVLDDSEGSGLGLIFALMLCKKAGFPQETFQIRSENNFTKVTFNISLSSNRGQHDLKITNKVIKELEKLPSFPENILKIQKICSNPDSSLKQISESIKNDPNLTSSVMRIANSAGFVNYGNTTILEDAVKLIGMKTINSLLVASGVEKILSSRYKKFEGIWQNSYKAAFYAHKMLMQTKQTKYIELVYQSALLSDIGKIILVPIEPTVIKKMNKVAGSRIAENTSLLEEINLGISHATLGALICEKWKFNESLVNIIKYHDRPHVAPAKYKPLVYLVYLAYSLIDIENRRLRFEILDEDVLNYFNINDKEKFELLHRTLKSTYDTQYMRV